jgi:hypothetical protein
VSEPEGIVAEADGVAARACPLADDGVGFGRDLREGNVDERGPDRSCAEGDFAAVAAMPAAMVAVTRRERMSTRVMVPSPCLRVQMEFVVRAETRLRARPGMRGGLRQRWR